MAAPLPSDPLAPIHVLLSGLAVIGLPEQVVLDLQGDQCRLLHSDTLFKDST